MDRYVITASLKEIRSGTRSQWRLMSAGEMCSAVVTRPPVEECFPRACRTMSYVRHLIKAETESKRGLKQTNSLQ